MVIQVLHCCHCQSQNVIRHGTGRTGHQRYRCHDCRRTFQETTGRPTHSAEFQALVLAAYQERCSMRGVCHLFGIGRNTLSAWLKKASQLPPLTKTLARDALEDVLELEELWSFVARRKNKNNKIRSGFGLPSAAAPGKLLPTR